MTRIIVDLQACQTQSRLRGMGRYAREITKCLIELSKDDHEIHLVANANLKSSLVRVLNEFGELVPATNIHFVKMPSDVGINHEENLTRAEVAKLIWESYIEALSPDVVFCPSLFEGFSDDAVTSAGARLDVPFVVTIHDLIPLINPVQYLNPFPDFKRAYLEKVDELKQATALIAISNSSLQEAVEHLGIEPNQIVNASEAADDVFAPRIYDQQSRQQLCQKLGIEDKFVLYTGGADPRKNLLRLVDAFALQSPAVLKDHQLVLAGGMPEFETNELIERAQKHGIADRVIFTGYVSDDDLIALFNLAELFVFPSLHEGFGLPPLEAMQCKTATIGANCTSIPEVIGDERALFDPKDTAAIADKMSAVLSDEQFKNELATNGYERSKKFNWRRSAQMIFDELLRHARPHQSNERREAFDERLDQIEDKLLANIAACAKGKLDDAELNAAMQNIADNRTSLRRRCYFSPRADGAWRLEGPFDSTYSLALVNRELAKALDQLGEEVHLWSSEGPGDFDPSPAFLQKNPQLAHMYDRARMPESVRSAGTLSRNMYPPRVDDIKHPNAGLHNYAWEETVLPRDFVNGFNENLRFITATSAHTKKILMDSGVDVPVSVVGNGCDHWDLVVKDPDFVAPGKAFKFLHVSSCFPRKGADVLLKAFGQAFSDDDDVSLVIKTFDNPHNDIADQLEHLRQSNPDFPHVEIIFGDLSDGALKALYEQCQVLVAPSRAEGFGLPIAEAMLSGLDVITTNWSGQLDFCSSEKIKLIDFDYALSQTHENSNNSVWAEPRETHLAQLMRQSFDEGERKRVSEARTGLRDRFTWAKVAERNLKARGENGFGTLPKVGWVSTFRKRCGIATYSEHLLQHFDCPTVVFAENTTERDKKDEFAVVPCWREGQDDLIALSAEIDRHKIDVVHVQFNYGFFEFAPFNQFLLDQKKAGRTLVVTLHSTIDPDDRSGKKLAQLREGLLGCDRLLVHAIGDLNRLKAHGLDQNATLLPHGCLTIPGIDNSENLVLPQGSEKITLGAYGFLLPNKGILELVQALKLLRDEGLNARLKLVNALYPSNLSTDLLDEVKALIEKLCLSEHIALHNEFLSDHESFQFLREADILIYPYGKTGESASGAVRYGIATGKPVLVSPSSIFDDISSTVHFLPGTAPEEVAKGIKETIERCNANDTVFLEKRRNAKAWREAHGYATISRRLSGLMRAVHQEAHRA